MVLQNYQNLIEMTSYIIDIVAFVVGFKCPRKIHLNTQCRGGNCPPLFVRIEGAAGGAASLLVLLLAPHFEKLLTPLILCNVSLVMKFLILLAKIRKKDLHSPNQRKLL